MTMRMMLALLVFAAVAATGCGKSSGSTRVAVEDDTVGTRGSGPYSADVKETTTAIISQLRRQKVLEDFRARHNEAPIIALIRPQNDTRFPEVTNFFQEDLVAALRSEFPVEELRISDRSRDVQAAITEEDEEKRTGARTDRTGPRTRLGADFFLKAKFTSLSTTDGRQSDDTVKYSYELIDAGTDELLFKGAKDIRRVSTASAVYR